MEKSRKLGGSARNGNRGNDRQGVSWGREGRAEMR
jgi:hypothetical protein